MRLKRLDLFGFKSFADRTVMDFDRPLTGIVGPNGCGKSNVVDAMRWVLGEQRPTSMRGAEMTDVIFKGSTSRPGLAVAEVTLVLDNREGAIPDRGAEVSITRRLYKSGEGEYQIDGERMRLKDVRNMLFDTGLGSRGYAVLEQGRIDAVLSANPIERRAIFEEAAGISRYRQRRHEAQNKLKRVERDVERLDDVIRELTSRSRSLKIQAGKAERFLSARDTWREKAEAYARNRAFELSQQREAGKLEIEQFESEAEELRGLRQIGEGETEQREREQAVLQEEVERLSGRSSELAGDLRALDERRTQLSSRIDSWRRMAREEHERGEALDGKLQVRLAEQKELVEREAALAEQAEEAQHSLQEKAAALHAVQGDARRSRAEAEEQSDKVLEILNRKTAAQNASTHFEQTLAPLAERGERAAERAHDARMALDEASAEESETQRVVQAAEHARQVLEQRKSGLDEQLANVTATVKTAAEHQQEAELERTGLASRIESLLDWEAEREGMEGGARALLELNTPELGGLLADHLRTSTDNARALDAVLGEFAQALVVQTPEVAVQMVNWLAEQSRGQVRLVLPQGLGRAAIAVNRDPGSVEGVVAILRERVEVTPGFEGLADLLLKDVWIVRDLQRGLELVAALPGLRCVTLDGDLIDVGGVRGGHREVAHGAIGRRASAAELSTRVAELEEIIARAKFEFEQGSIRLRDLRQESALVADELEQGRQTLAAARGAEESARARLRDMRETLLHYERDVQTIAAESEQLQRELTQAREQLAAAEIDFERENAELVQRVERQRELDLRHEEFARLENTARLESTRTLEQLTSLRQRLEDLCRVVEEARVDRARVQEQSAEHSQNADAGEKQFEDIDRERGEKLTERGELEEKLMALREREIEARKQIEEFRNRADAVTHKLEGLNATLSDSQLKQQRFELEREELLRRASEELSLSEFDLLDGFEPDEALLEEGVLRALGEESRELKRELDKIGSVNLEAVEELEEVTERLTFLEEQRADVMRARAALLGTLRTINEQSERLFLEAFNDVRENFRAIFRQLFGGGRADVVLEADVPLLEAGIEITARPPGREMLPLGLLSGGQRTMTALALLFAVFQSRPSPFCVLDEVDAALDDANIGRFLVLLDGFLSSTQFVVVTHNKGTMSACDVLYGVTMETKGVSRHVAVELSDVDEFVPDATGDAVAALDARDEVVADADALDSSPEEEEPVVELIPHSAAGDRAAETSGDTGYDSDSASDVDPAEAAQEERGEPTIGAEKATAE